jgi:ABC-type antimicrobial peptide transport system permease subunit
MAVKALVSCLFDRGLCSAATQRLGCYMYIMYDTFSNTVLVGEGLGLCMLLALAKTHLNREVAALVCVAGCCAPIFHMALVCEMEHALSFCEMRSFAFALRGASLHCQARCKVVLRM